MSTTPLHITCVLRSGGAYTAKYVNNLFNGIVRNTKTPITFTAITDLTSGFLPAIQILPFKHQWPGWWSKIEMFRQNIWSAGRVWYFDLDTIFVGELTSILTDERYGDNFYTLNDPYVPGRLASGVMTWKANDEVSTQIYERFVLNDKNIISSCGSLGDQCWIGSTLTTRYFVQDLHPSKFVSLKRDCIDGRCVGSSSVVYFHGKPRPHEALINHETAWVRKYWH